MTQDQSSSHFYTTGAGETFQRCHWMRHDGSIANRLGDASDRFVLEWTRKSGSNFVGFFSDEVEGRRQLGLCIQTGNGVATLTPLQPGWTE